MRRFRRVACSLIVSEHELLLRRTQAASSVQAGRSEQDRQAEAEPMGERP